MGKVMELLGCRAQELPLKYLGFPLGASPRLKETWKPVAENMKKKLASWKKRFLSFGGRMTLIKSVLSNLPVYYLSIFKMPEGVAEQIDRIQSGFLWDDEEVKKKVHLVNWDRVSWRKK